MATLRDIKAALRAEGIEVYLTKEDAIHIAERPRENLIMDSGVRLFADLRVGFYARSEASSFPGLEAEQMYDRVRRQLAPAGEHGFAEVRHFVNDIEAPSDATKILDRWFEIFYVRECNSLDEALQLVRTAIGFNKVVKR